MTDPKDFPQTIVLLRECPAVRIPEGSELVLTAGTEVYVTQALGGSVTVNVRGNLARISAANLDALGMAPATPVPEQTAASQAGDVDVALVWEQLSTCYDPEIPINIVELGLIYRCEILPAEQGKRVEIDMTLTAAGCGMGPILVEDVRSKVAQVPNVSEVEVDLVFDPPWSQDMMSEAARLETGLY